MPTTSTSPTRTVEGHLVPEVGTWTIDPSHTDLDVVARHLMVTKVRGRFTDIGGTVLVAEDPTASSVEVEIRAASIDTGAPDRDNHLRSADFLDVEHHPTITFRSTSLEPKDGAWRLHGALTVRGLTRPLTLDLTFEGAMTDPFGNTKAAFSLRGAIDREAWGLTWNVPLEDGGVLVSKTMQVEIEAQATLQS